MALQKDITLLNLSFFYIFYAKKNPWHHAGHITSYIDKRGGHLIV
jgi:hypothetical protein